MTSYRVVGGKPHSRCVQLALECRRIVYFPPVNCDQLIAFADAAPVRRTVVLYAIGNQVFVRSNLYELDRLRVETAEQRDQIQTYAQKMEAISAKLGRIDGFERKLRIITNLDPADPLVFTIKPILVAANLPSQ